MIRDPRTGAEWGTAAELAAALGPDVTEAMVRRWRDPKRHGLTTRRAHGRAVSPLAEAAELEAKTRDEPRGRPRQLDVDQAAA